MNRFLLVIAVLFALASSGGATMANAASSGEFWSVSSSGQCIEPTAEFEPAPAFKRCGKKVNGQAVPCQPSPAVMPVAVGFMAARGQPRYAVASEATPTLSVFRGWFRPPRG